MLGEIIWYIWCDFKKMVGLSSFLAETCNLNIEDLGPKFHFEAFCQCRFRNSGVGKGLYNEWWHVWSWNHGRQPWALEKRDYNWWTTGGLTVVCALGSWLVLCDGFVTFTRCGRIQLSISRKWCFNVKICSNILQGTIPIRKKYRESFFKPQHPVRCASITTYHTVFPSNSYP